LDVVAQAGGAKRALDKVYTVTITGGQLAIRLVSSVDDPMVNAIAIVPTVGPASMAAPQLQTLGSVPTNGTISANYPDPRSDILLEWKIESAESSSIASPVFATTGSAEHLSLAPFNLAPGYYRVSVRAVNALTHDATEFYEAYLVLVSGSASAMSVYPNPWRADRHQAPVHFKPAPANATLKIFSVSGHHVRTLHESAGEITWDLQNDSGQNVASGIYLYLMTSNDGEKRGKLAVVR
jgi:hypothetical protein